MASIRNRRKYAAEAARVDAFIHAIRLSAIDHPPLIAHDDTCELPRIIATTAAAL